MKSNRMKAAVWYGHKDIRVEERPVPEVRPGYVRIRVAYAGICGTDRHEYTGPNFIPVEKPHRLTGKTAPLILGHEFTGIIDAVGEGVRGYRPGDRVTANGTLCCGECRMCKMGRYNVCERLGFLGVGLDGAFAEYVLVEAARLFPLPENVSLREGVLAEPLACGIHATGLLGDVRGNSVVVVGPGIIGLSCMLAAKFAGAGSILVVGVGKARKALVESYGCLYHDALEGEATAAVLRAHGGPADVVYECVGSQRTLDDCIAATRHGGRLMVMGVFEERPVFDMNTFQEGERILFTSQAHVDEIAVALERISRGMVDASALVTREVVLDTLVRDGFEELLANGPAHVKILIRIGGGT